MGYCSAGEEADEAYSGTYVGLGSSAMPNSSMVITTDAAKPGLGLIQWTSNGTDMIKLAIELQTGVNAVANVEARLYYTQIETNLTTVLSERSW